MHRLIEDPDLGGSRALIAWARQGPVVFEGNAPADVADVLTAAGKRVGEALRAIEEFLKTVAPDEARRVEAARYRFYDFELRVTLGEDHWLRLAQQ